MNQFYLAYNDSDLWKAMAKVDYPVIGMDSYCPVVSPFTTSVHGHLGVLVAMGTSGQVRMYVCFIVHVVLFNYLRILCAYH